MTRVTEEQFWSRYDEDENGCWIWRSPVGTNGYGYVTINGKKWLTHRYAYTLVKGEIPAGLEIDHLCRVTRCMNPDHLEAVTPRENNLRGFGLAARRARMTHCPRGHAFTPENIYSRPDRVGSRMCRACCRLRESKRVRVWS